MRRAEKNTKPRTSMLSHGGAPGAIKTAQDHIVRCRATGSVRLRQLLLGELVPADPQRLDTVHAQLVVDNTTAVALRAMKVPVAHTV